MFDKMNQFKKQVELVQRLMKDEQFKAFMSHPKVQSMFADPEFRTALQTQNPQTILQHPKLATLREDPEVRDLILKLDFRKIMGL